MQLSSEIVSLVFLVKGINFKNGMKGMVSGHLPISNMSLIYLLVLFLHNGTLGLELIDGVILYFY